MAEAGLQVDSHTELMDRQFWASVPDTGKRSVLLSGEPGAYRRAISGVICRN